MVSVKTLIREGEHQTQDFKFRIDDQKKIARTLAAFANTDGGRLQIGVKDNGKIAGVNPEEEFHMVQGAAQMYCRPPVQIESRIWQEDMRLVLEISVEPAPQRNHYAVDEDGKWKIFIRRKDHTLLANKILLKVWNFEKQGILKPQSFGEEELRCIRIIESEARVTLSRLYKMLDIQKQKVDHLLALLVHWRIVDMQISEEGVFYSIL